MVTRTFDVWDWVVFGALLTFSALVGVFYAVKDHLDQSKNTTGEFLMGGRKMSLLPVSVSILVSFMSAITILGAPAEMYTAGTLYFLYTIGLVLACILSERLFVPLFYPLRLTSSFEYLEKRFQSKAAKLTGTIILIVQQLLYMGIATFAPSTALEAVTGFPTWATIISVGLVSTFYTFLGGMKAVVWTDFFQGMVMIVGLVAIAIQGFVKVGGFGEVWRINEEWGRIDFWEGDPNPAVRHSVWSLVVGGTILWLGAFGTSQASVQRYSALPTLRKAKLSVLLNIPGCIVLMLLTCLAGIAMFAYYTQGGCDPLSAGEVNNSNQLIPYFVMEVLGYPGLPGLFLSCLFSGALSTMSSSLNALSAVFWQDIIEPFVGDKCSDAVQTWITRLLVVLFGGAGIGIAFMATTLGGTVLQASFSFVGAATGPNIGIFLLGALFPWTNAAGCVAGGVIGLIFSMWISIGAYTLPRTGGYNLPFPTAGCSTPTDPFNLTTTSVTANMTTTSAASIAPPAELTGLQSMYTVSYLWFPSIGMATTIIIGIITSLITAPWSKKIDVDPKYLIPIFDRLFCCFPEKWRSPCRCGYDYTDPEVLTADILVEKQEENRAYDNCGSINRKRAPADSDYFTDGVAALSYRNVTPEDHIYDNMAYAESGIETFRLSDY